MSANTCQRQLDGKLFVLLMLGALVGALGLLPYALALAPPTLPPGAPPLALLVALWYSKRSC